MASRIVSICFPLCADFCNVLVLPLTTEKYRGKRQKRKYLYKLVLIAVGLQEEKDDSPKLNKIK